MPQLIFTVKKISQGWMVSGSPPTGPFACKEHALDLAQGMADAIMRSGGVANVIVET